MLLFEFAGLTPHDAYSRDVTAAGRHEDLGPDDAGWLATAQLLWRLAQSGREDRAEVWGEYAERLGGDGESGSPLPVPVRRAVASFLQAAPEERPGRAEELGAVVQALTVEAERHGAYRLAYVTLESVVAVVEDAGVPATVGLSRAQQGRIARQVGALEIARERYRQALQLGRETHHVELTGRAMLGMGVLGNMRGNYPEARRWFGRALTLGTRVPHPEFERAAHHGLLHAALAAGDADAAIRHGWIAVRDAAGNPDAQAELLTNIGEVCRALGAWQAARGAYQAALAQATITRIRMAALGGAIAVAAHDRAHDTVRELTRAIDGSIAASGQPYEDAMLCIAAAESHAELEAWDVVERYAALGAAIAEDHGFHEVAHRIGTLRERAERTRSTQARSTQAREDSVAAADAATAQARRAALSRESTHVLSFLSELPDGQPFAAAPGAAAVSTRAAWDK